MGGSGERRQQMAHKAPQKKPCALSSWTWVHRETPTSRDFAVWVRKLHGGQFWQPLSSRAPCGARQVCRRHSSTSSSARVPSPPLLLVLAPRNRPARGLLPELLLSFVTCCHETLETSTVRRPERKGERDRWTFSVWGRNMSWRARKGPWMMEVPVVSQ